MTALETILAAAAVEAFPKTASLKKVADIKEARKVVLALEKVSALSYTAEAMHAIQGIMKIASATMDGLIAAVEAEAGQVTELKKIAEVRAVLDDMIECGMISKSEVREKSAALLKKTERELEIVKEAMQLTKSAGMSNLFEVSATTSTNDKPAVRGMFDAAMNN